MTQPSGRFRGYGYADYSLLRDIEFDSIDGWASILASKQQKRKRLRESNDPLFNSLFELLKQQCGEKCSQDVWHIRTAERHGMLCFLTTDKTLLKAYKSLIHKEPLRSLTTRVMSPEELAVYLEIRPVKPHLLSYNDADGPVQMDHTMPEERRRKGSEYR